MFLVLRKNFILQETFKKGFFFKNIQKLLKLQFQLKVAYSDHFVPTNICENIGDDVEDGDN